MYSKLLIIAKESGKFILDTTLKSRPFFSFLGGATSMAGLYEIPKNSIKGYSALAIGIGIAVLARKKEEKKNLGNLTSRD